MKKIIIVVFVLLTQNVFSQKWQYIEVSCFYNFKGSKIKFYLTGDESLDSLWMLSKVYNEKKKHDEITFVEYDRATDFWDKLGEIGYELVTTTEREAPNALQMLVNTAPTTI